MIDDTGCAVKKSLIFIYSLPDVRELFHICDYTWLKK